MPCVFFFFINGVQILSPSYYFRWLEALRGQQWNGKEHGSLLLELMLTESERSCHVFWQLTQWVWILQHKVGPFSLSTCLLGNVPSSCFHIDLITLPHWWAWHKTYFLYCCVHHIPFPALQLCYFGLQMEDLVSAFPLAAPASVTTQMCRNPSTLEEQEGAVGLPGDWLPGFAIGELGRRGDTGSSRGFTAFEVKSLPVLLQEMLIRAGFTAQGWDGLHTEQSLKGGRQHSPPSWQICSFMQIDWPSFAGINKILLLFLQAHWQLSLLAATQVLVLRTQYVSLPPLQA